MQREVHAYLSKIGRKGGLRSRRRLDPDSARAMVRVREARRAFKQLYARCFWSFDPNHEVKSADVAWVAERLMTYGGRAGWAIGARLCR